MANRSQFFTVMVVGDNPNELMSQYDSNLKVERYIKYKYLDAEKMRKNSVKILTEITTVPQKFGLSNFQTDYFKEKLKNVKDMTSFEYYTQLTHGLYYDEEGNALTDENPKGKWQTCKIGDAFSLPLILNNGEQVHSALNKDINWDAMHMHGVSTYECVWDMIKGDKQPSNETEQKMYDNMKGNINYFNRFKNKEEYVLHNCSYWNYAYLDENGWQDMDDANRDFDWISTYYDKFIANLKPTDKITIFECSKGKDDDAIA